MLLVSNIVYNIILIGVFYSHWCGLKEYHRVMLMFLETVACAYMDEGCIKVVSLPGLKKPYRQ